MNSNRNKKAKAPGGKWLTISKKGEMFAIEGPRIGYWAFVFVPSSVFSGN